jgi:hypothetical protein
MMVLAASVCSCGSSSEQTGSEQTSGAIEPIGMLEFADSDCRVAVDPNAPLRTSGVLDYVEGNAYGGALLVKVGTNISALSVVAVQLEVDGSGLEFAWPWSEFPSDEITRSGGQAVVSAPWQDPIELCYGCLVAFPPEAMVAQADGSLRCTVNVPSPLCSQLECPCASGSDEPIDCRLCARDPVCMTPP